MHKSQDGNVECMESEGTFLRLFSGFSWVGFIFFKGLILELEFIQSFLNWLGTYLELVLGFIHASF